MKIKRLDIVGFKSFVDKVSLDFQQGITGVVGPNGCGKSNIVDAIRWAMGEQNPRYLRGRMMEDVIFGGSETRKPHGMAQVSLIFDNSAGICPPAYKDFAEIMITRRLYRNGESDYLINKTPCRLLDITELFMDTGVGARAYSIIEQGKVGMLVSAKPEERRALIEEAAGVTKFKARKKTAERKIEATGQNLLRLGDIITEVRRRIGSLKRQAQQAEKYREYRSESKRLELSLVGNRLRQLNGEIELVTRREKDQAVTLERLDTRLADDELGLEKRLLQHSEAEADFSRAQEQLYHSAAEIQRVENDLALSARQREDLERQDQDLQAELHGSTRRLDELELEYADLIGRRNSSEADLSELKSTVEQTEEDLRQRLVVEQEVARRFASARGELLELTAHTGRIHSRGDDISRRLNLEAERRLQLEQGMAGLRRQLQTLSRDRDGLQQEIAGLQSQQEAKKNRIQELVQDCEIKVTQLNKEENAVSALRQALGKALSRRESLLELHGNREGFGEGARAFFAAEHRRGRLAADLMRVPEALEMLVEVALGERLQAVVPDPDTDLTQTLSCCEEQQARVTLLLPGFMKGLPDFPAATPLADLVTPVAAAEALVKQLLAGIYQVEDVARYQDQQLPFGVLLIDRKGTCLDWRGLLSGGSPRIKSSGLLRRQRRLEELAAEIARLQKHYDEIHKRCENLTSELQLLEEEKTGLTAQSHALELQLVELGKDRQGLNREEDHLNKRLALMTYDLEQLDDDHERLRLEQEQLGADLLQAQQRQEQVSRTYAELEDQMAVIRQELDHKREHLTLLKVGLAEQRQQQQALYDTLVRIDRQREEIRRRESLLGQRRESALDSRDKLQLNEKRLRAELDVLLSRRGEFQGQVELKRQVCEEHRTQIEAMRERSRQVRNEAEKLRRTVAQLQLRQRELRLEADHVRQACLERYRIDLLEHQLPEVTDAELDRQQGQLQRLQEKLESLGQVNLMAIDEYREQEDRYNFLCRQRDDLNQSLDDLQKAIHQINRTTRRRFKETFEQVNERFRTVFPRLFRGGQAELRLTDEQDLLETGVEMIVQPPGKRLQNVNLLSGGEKALSAVALIFSLFLIKPTPFCILDEVDAPLDDANIDRFADMVRDMNRQSQFIVITHSKRTMRIVDTMYGVTMQEPGVSRLVSVRLNDLVETDRVDVTAAV